MKSLLVTGGSGFIGSNFIHHVLQICQDLLIINFDKLTYAGNPENLADIEKDHRYFFVRGDICDRHALETVFAKHAVDSVVHFAAETHVDRSILGSGVFVQTNILGTHTLLECSLAHGVERFLHVSTDEVYGSLGTEGKFNESTLLHPNSPYAASKAGSDLLAMAYFHTHGVPVVTTRCSNNYGPYQFPEKLIPLMIVNALNGKPLPVYGDGLNVRDWLHVSDHCAALLTVLRNGRVGEIYNVGGNNEWTNIDIVRQLLKHLGKPDSLITFVKDRPGHDRRYAIEAAKINNELHWSPRITFEEGLRSTVEWYVKNERWWNRVISGEYQHYYQTMYEGR